MSTAPFQKVRAPSRESVRRMVEGLESAVLPMPYHMQPMPTPARMALRPALRVLPSDACASSRCQWGLRASRHAARPALASSIWPLWVLSPARSALMWRKSSRSMPEASARSSISVSWAMAACGTPKPRKAPAGVSLV